MNKRYEENSKFFITDAFLQNSVFKDNDSALEYIKYCFDHNIYENKHYADGYQKHHVLPKSFIPILKNKISKQKNIDQLSVKYLLDDDFNLVCLSINDHKYAHKLLRNNTVGIYNKKMNKQTKKE